MSSLAQIRDALSARYLTSRCTVLRRPPIEERSKVGGGRLADEHEEFATDVACRIQSDEDSTEAILVGGVQSTTRFIFLVEHDFTVLTGDRILVPAQNRTYEVTSLLSGHTDEFFSRYMIELVVNG